MTSRAGVSIVVLIFAMALFPFIAYAADADRPIMPCASIEAQAALGAQPMDLEPEFSALLVNGKKGSAYKAYTSYPYTNSALIYRARIVGSKLCLSGTYRVTGATASASGKTRKVKGAEFMLTSKTKYYQHVGNGSYFKKSSKAKMKKLFADKPADWGGDISFTLKSGRVTLLIAQ